MRFSVASFFGLLAVASGVLSAPLGERQTAACFLKGNRVLPEEVANGIPALVKAVTCTSGTSVASITNVASGGIDFKSIDFQKSKKSPLGFALQTFTTPTDLKQADLTKLQNQLNVYLAVEAGLRSDPKVSSATITRVKSVKFFIQFQIARIKTAQGAKLSVANTVEHQLGKVIKNAVGASSSEKAQVNALAKAL